MERRSADARARLAGRARESRIEGTGRCPSSSIEGGSGSDIWAAAGDAATALNSRQTATAAQRERTGYGCLAKPVLPSEGPETCSQRSPVEAAEADLELKVRNTVTRKTTQARVLVAPEQRR